MMAAAILADGPVRLQGVPRLSDVDTLSLVLGELGMAVARTSDDELLLQTLDPRPLRAPYELVRRMRASFCVLGPLLARRRRAVVSLPGGCNIGHRPVDLHLGGLSERTHAGYLRAVRQLADYSKTAPDKITENQLRRYFLFLKNEKQFAYGSLRVAYSGIKFFYTRTCKREWQTLAQMKLQNVKSLPEVLTIAQVHQPASSRHEAAATSRHEESMGSAKGGRQPGSDGQSRPVDQYLRALNP